MKGTVSHSICCPEVAPIPHWKAIYYQDRSKEFDVFVGTEDHYSFSIILAFKAYGF